MMEGCDDRSGSGFDGFVEALARRYGGELQFAELRRALQALSGRYVEGRSRRPPGSGGVLDGSGKRAAFALFYGALHFAVVGRIVRELDAVHPPCSLLLDLGCGTGVAAAAWALECDERKPRLEGVDTTPWAVNETRWTWHRFGLRGRARRADLTRVRLPGRGAAIVAAYAVNELQTEARDRLLGRLRSAAGRGAGLLIVEPIARRPVPWWGAWAEAFDSYGGRADIWRFPAALPERLHRLDRAAGLNHEELTARSLFVRGGTG